MYYFVVNQEIVGSRFGFFNSLKQRTCLQEMLQGALDSYSLSKPSA